MEPGFANSAEVGRVALVERVALAAPVSRELVVCLVALCRAEWAAAHARKRKEVIQWLPAKSFASSVCLVSRLSTGALKC